MNHSMPDIASYLLQL